MLRIGKPKVALIPLERPQRLPKGCKVVKVNDKDWGRTRALFLPYRNLFDVVKMAQEKGAKYFYTIDRDRVINFISSTMKRNDDRVSGRKLVEINEKDVDKQFFYIEDFLEETFWSV